MIQGFFRKHPNLPLLFGILALIGLGLASYWTSFGGVFLMDDTTNILNFAPIHSLSFPWTFMQNVRRPILYLTLALNYAVGGFNPVGYHAFNLIIHIAAAFFLWGIVSRTMQFRFSVEKGKEREPNLKNGWLAWCSAAIWLVHPLQTESVTYIIQRAESLMGMFFLASVYSSIRYFANNKLSWMVSAVLLAVLSGLTKEVAVVLPVVVLLYDRTFVSGNFKQALTRHYQLYLGFLIQTGSVFFLFFTTNTEVIPTAGFAYKKIALWQYALTQPEIILHYLKLVVWPYPLVFDYGWMPVKTVLLALPALFFIGVMIVVSLYLYNRHSAIGFLGLSLFLILSPSSSFIPLKDLAFEHRMYLPAAGVIVGLVFGLKNLCGVLFGNTRSSRILTSVIVVVLVVILSALTAKRNMLYHDPLAMWKDVLAKRPLNPRAQNNYGRELNNIGKISEAMYYYKQAIKIDPDYADAYLNYGGALIQEGKFAESISYTDRALKLNPYDGIGYNNFGAALANMDRFAEAIPYYQTALHLGFTDPGVYHNLGVAFAKTGRPLEAIANIEEALKQNPNYPDAQKHLEEIQKRLARQVTK